MGQSRPIRVISGIALLLALPLFAYAADFRAGDTVTIPQGETIIDDTYATGSTVESRARISGDLFIAGGTISVSGTVDEDAVLGGGEVMVTGSIADDLRVGGGKITVESTVGGDLIAGGGEVRIRGGRIGGDALVGGGMVRIDSPVMGDVRVGGATIYINSAVSGDVEADADTLTLGPEARIAGDLVYRSSHEVALEEGAVVSGETTYEQRYEGGSGFLMAFFSVASLVFLLLMGLGAAVFGLFFNRYGTEVVENAFASPLMEFGRGVLTVVAVPLISLILFITIIGVPFGFLGIFLFLSALIVSWLMAPILLGSLLYHWIYKGEFEVNWKTMLLGLLVFFVIGFIPILGGIIQLGCMLLALGSIIRLTWHIAKTWR